MSGSDQKAWDQLQLYGKFGDSFDSLLNRLTDAFDKAQKL
jgi:hypothetical protein